MSADNPVSTQPPAVALVFENAQQSAHLRESLVALGADIVLEAPVADIDRQALADSGADVVVINLDAAVEPHLDRIHDAVEASGQRVVYNDGDVSARLSGWDQARWARHLAAKLMDQFDSDPPRPEDVPAVQVPVPRASAQIESTPDEDARTESASGKDDLTGELGALMAEGRNLLAELHAADTSGVSPTGHGAADAPEAENGLESDPPPMTVDVGNDHADAVADDVAPASPQAPDWELIATDAEPAAAHARDDFHMTSATHDETPLDPASFGIDKVSAAEYLTPSGEDVAESPIEPGFSLELVSLEESIAPTMVETHGSENSMDVSTGLRKLVVIGATAGRTGSVRDFLHALSARPDAAMLLVQHQDGIGAEALRVRLAEAVQVPVRMAEHGATIRRGELTVVPGGQQPTVDRNGRIQLDEASGSACDPSIDAALSTAAAQFGNDALAILLVDDANDAVAGAQAIHDRGGRLWLHHHADGEPSLMVAMLRQEGLINVEDTPASFAARLLEEEGTL